MLEMNQETYSGSEEPKVYGSELYDREDISKSWRVARYIRDGHSLTEAANKFGLSMSTAQVYFYTGRTKDLDNAELIKIPANRFRAPRGSYRKSGERRQGLEGLSIREREVVDLVRQGLFNKEIADKLFVTEKTVKFHLTNAFRILGVKSRAQIIARMPWTGVVEEKPESPTVVKSLADFSTPKAPEKSFTIDKCDYEPVDTCQLPTHSEFSLPSGSSPLSPEEKRRDDFIAKSLDAPNTKGIAQRAIDMIFDGTLSPDQGKAIAALLAVK